MEEKVGELWHRLVTRMAAAHYPEAVVTLAEVERTAGILFRALGGDSALRVEAVTATEYRSRRGWLQRLADHGTKVELAWRDEKSLRLPPVIDYFPDRQLNRDLYLWLAVMAVGDEPLDERPWFGKNQHLSLQALNAFPGIEKRYHRLVQAHIRQRPLPARLPRAEAEQEQAIREALQSPGCIAQLPPASRLPFAVPLWLHPFPPQPPASSGGQEAEPEHPGHSASRCLEQQQRRAAERVDKPEGQDKGLITLRMENIFSWGEFVNLDRSTDEDEDLDNAADAATDMELLSVSKDAKGTAGTLRFDLDLPAAANDDEVLHDGILLPEWDYKKQRLQADHCRLLPMITSTASSSELPDHLRKTARHLRAQFQQLAAARSWQRAQQEGSEIDIDAYLQFASDRAAGHIASADGLYRDLRVTDRDLACLLLADLSLSTDSWINNRMRVIDVIRDSLLLFAESLAASGDQFAIYGFSSRKRDPIRYHHLKTFGEPYAGKIRGRINAIKPGYYTRMGAAIRHSSALLSEQPAARRLLLILTDGKPNDLDKYEGRYGIEDTRHAIQQARRLGLQPFCVTIDEKGNNYLPYLFGTGGYVVIHKPSQLPKELPRLYAQLRVPG